ncbi:MAG: histidine phosphatase family protein, partial [Anaerolineales bacterium]
LVPDLILSSTAKRARRTAELVAEACGYENEIVFTRDLYHGAPDDYIDSLNVIAGDEDVIMVVGHNPGMEELLDVLTGESAYLTTANIAQVALPIDGWRGLDEFMEGRLINLWRPKDLGGKM